MENKENAQTYKEGKEEEKEVVVEDEEEDKE